ncbi:hypothetical protein BAE44_0010075 [Dichanthelium oligosanthes]|uniref:Uncharacterized protein n=1 Tax=Dichanthelium oligosanthes TaxID=888268 RepID=A0A1E5VUV4_9POAL|nr:hypothetical protein BAE44_0010075 [Dichanthelium oligosanthes]
MSQATAATAAAVKLPRDALLRIAAPLREPLAAAPYEPPAGSTASVKSLLASLLPSASPSQPQPQPGVGKEVADLLLFCAAVLAASPEHPALHWVPAGLAGAVPTAVGEMAAAGGWGSVGEMVMALMPEVVPPLKAVVKDSCVDADNDEIGAVKPPKEHAVVAAHQFRWLVSQWMHTDDDKTVLLVLEQVHAIIKLTWIRKSPHTSRCKGQQFDEAWKKHELDPDLTMLLSSFNQLCIKNSSPGC